MQSPHTETPARDPWPWVVLALVLLLAILAAWPLLTTADFLTTRHLGDSPFLLFRTQQLADALADGVFPVRWMPDGAFGLGYPFFHYYAALPFYLAAGLHLAGVPLVLSLKITVVAGFALAAWGMYGWVYAMTRHRAGAVLAAVAYTLAPYHLVNVYLRGDALSEFWAMSWYPLILWSLYAAAREPSRPRLAAVAVSYGALVLTHNVSALLFSPFVALYALGLVAQNGRHRFGMLAGAGILGLALAAWFWFPALNETDAVQLDGQAAGFFFYGNHFRSGDLIQADWAFDYTVLGEDANAQALGRMQGLLMGLGALAVIWRFWRYKHAWRELFILGGLGLSLYMITPDSEPLWANVPLLELAQFPWRFLSIVALFGAASTAALADLHALPGRAPRLDAGIVLVVGGLLAYTSLTNLETDFIPLRDDDITAERMHAYEAFTGALGTTIGGEYLPRWVDEPPHTSDIFLGRAPRAQFLSGEGDARRVDTRAHAQTWRVDIQAPGAQVALPLHYWPGWRAQADGRAVQAAPLQGMGYTQVNLPPGEYDLHLRLGRPAERLIPELLSLAALGVVLGLAWPALRRIPPQNALGALLSVVFVIFILGLARPEPDTSLVTADFAQRAFHHPQAATYRDGVRWLGADVRQIGGELELTFNWDRVPPGQLRVELAPSLGLRSLGAPLYPLTTGARLDADIWQATFGLNDIAPGVYFPRVMRFPAETDTSELRNSSDPLTEHGYGRGPLHLL
ncbi:MAG: 6-pyruvoyl-tetrahydropterin synthase-related protein, partial [Anaerolineales bacterium]